MNVHIHKSLSALVRTALTQTLNLFTNKNSYQLVESMADANVVFVQGRRNLDEIHNYDYRFILFPDDGETSQRHNIPENVQILDTPPNTIQCLQALDIARKALAMSTGALPAQEPAAAAMANKPRVLVIDDSQVHCQTAKRQLASNYLLTVVTTYRQALDALKQVPDVVLTDLMLPASDETLGPDAIAAYAGQEMPLGFVIALLAAKAGCARVGVVTDLNHHAHPMSAALDHFNQPLDINGAKVVFTNRGGEDGKPWRDVLEQLLKD